MKSKQKPKQPMISVRRDTYGLIEKRARRQGMSVSQTLEKLIIGALAGLDGTSNVTKH